jgi:hypothetical protein
MPEEFLRCQSISPQLRQYRRCFTSPSVSLENLDRLLDRVGDRGPRRTSLHGFLSISPGFTALVKMPEARLRTCWSEFRPELSLSASRNR